MAFKGFRCEADGEPIEPLVCLTCARVGALDGCQMTAPVINGILKGMRPDNYGPTVTTLLGCIRKVRLMQSTDYWLRPAEMWWAYRGQLMHGIAAEYAAGDPNCLAETRFSCLVEPADGEPFTVTGQPDLVLLDRRHLVDYKTTKRIPGPWRTWLCPDTGAIIRESQFAWRNKWLDCPHCEAARHVAKEIECVGHPRPYQRHVEQVSLYRLFLADNGIAIDTAEILYMDMAEQLRVPVDLLSIDDARVLLEERAALYRQPDLPGILTDPGDQWECDFCPVRAACAPGGPPTPQCGVGNGQELYGGPVGKRLEEEAQ